MTTRGEAPPASLLLGRTEFAGDPRAALDHFRGRRVLVTGAAGSVGWPLCHVLLRAEPASLVLLDHHEHSLFSLERSLVACAGTPRFELLDVRDTRATERAFARHQPEVVVHLAAAKHVPYGERFPEGVVQSNVFATDSLLRLSAETGVQTFVYPSSDKSVDPPSLYGATKRICEGLVQSYQAADRRWLVVRYVNIIGTRGSVIETFTQQIQQQQPMTLTDERMTRYWISMDEAHWLILQAAAVGTAGTVLMPDCGHPIPVAETARSLARWYQPQSEPYPIRMMGSRPGERLHEILLSENEHFATGPASGVLAVARSSGPAALRDVPSIVEQLRADVDSGNVDGLRRLTMESARALQ